VLSHVRLEVEVVSAEFRPRRSLGPEPSGVSRYSHPGCSEFLLPLGPNKHLVWRHPKVHGYYNNGQGRVTKDAPWRLLDYWKMTAEPDPTDHLLTTSPNTETRLVGT